jgi:hypothetical protein
VKIDEFVRELQAGAVELSRSSFYTHPLCDKIRRRNKARGNIDEFMVRWKEKFLFVFLSK